MFFITGLQTIPLFGETAFSVIVYDYLLYIASYIFIFYCFYTFISIRHHKKNKILLLLISGLLFTAAADLPITYIYLYLLSPEVLSLQGNEFRIMFSRYYMSFLETNFLFAVSGALLKTALHHYVNIMEQKESEKQLILGDLALLKSQINPVFLFSTLTSIKTLIEEKPDKAINSIENLSEIMSYMLYETNSDSVPLDKEIENIKNYLNLQSIKYRNECIQFSVKGNVNSINVPPLIFMPFIEKAFKDSDSDKDTIKITFEITESDLIFKLSSSLKNNLKLQESEGNFSIDKIEKQLDVLLEKNYKLESGITTSGFEVTFCIYLNKKVTGG